MNECRTEVLKYIDGLWVNSLKGERFEDAMSEERILELTGDMVSKQIQQAKIKRDKGSQAEIVQLDSDIMNIKREINWELRALSEEQVATIDVETDDTQRNR